MASLIKKPVNDVGARGQNTSPSLYKNHLERKFKIKSHARSFICEWLFDGSPMIFVIRNRAMLECCQGNVAVLKFIVLPLRKKADEKPAFFTCFSQNLLFRA
jgi:hypothetical protein